MITADDVGIHFRGTKNRDNVLYWGEIASVDAVRDDAADGSTSVEIFVDHISGVDFRFDSAREGYEQVMAAMEQHLIGFSRAKAEAAGTWKEKKRGDVVWKRDETIQPFQLHPPEIDSRPPTQEELKQMDAAHQASIVTCVKLLGRPLQASELDCIHIDFENGRIVGSIAHPLCDLLVKRQSEIQNRANDQHKKDGGAAPST